MKNTKWIWRVLVALLTLVVLAGVGFTGYRVGIVQGADLTAEELSSLMGKRHDFDGNRDMLKDGGHGSNHGRGSDGQGGHPGRGGRGGFGGFNPLFGLLHLALLGGLAWLGYRYIKNSGWRLVKTETAAPTANEPQASAPENEKKDSE